MSRARPDAVLFSFSACTSLDVVDGTGFFIVTVDLGVVVLVVAVVLLSTSGELKQVPVARRISRPGLVS